MAQKVQLEFIRIFAVLLFMNFFVGCGAKLPNEVEIEKDIRAARENKKSSYMYKGDVTVKNLKILNIEANDQVYSGRARISIQINTIFSGMRNDEEIWDFRYVQTIEGWKFDALTKRIKSLNFAIEVEKRNLNKLMIALSIYYGSNEGVAPKSLKELAPKYIKVIPSGDWEYNLEKLEIRFKKGRPEDYLTIENIKTEEALLKEEALLEGSKKKLTQEDRKLKDNLSTLRSALSIYYGKHEGVAPKTLNDLVPEILDFIPAGDWEYDSEEVDVISKSHPDW